MMITYQDLYRVDSSLKLIKGSENQISLLSISHYKWPIPSTFIFLKNESLFKKFLNFNEGKEFLKTGVIVEESLDESLVKKLESQFEWIGSVSSVDKAMSFFSKVFYDNEFAEINFQVDGRQIGNVEISPDAEISQNVFIGENVLIEDGVRILPGCTILPNCEIKAGTTIYPNVVLYPKTKIGKNCRVHAGTVIGADGFGYNFFDGKHNKIWHLAGVEIYDDVEIGANTMIDSGAFTPTVIGEGSRIDNDVQIAHNAKIGNHVILCGKVGLAGSVEVGDYTAFGAGSGSQPGATLGVGVQVAARAVISENAKISDKEIVAGHPARPLKEWMRSQATLRRLTKK